MIRLLLRVSFLSAVLLATSAASSRAAWPVVVSETVYTPASSILTVPTAYVVPTSVTYSGLQTYRYRPTSYYLAESSYVLPRRYYRPTTYYLPRSYVTTSLVDYAVTPTSYYLPTTWETPVVATSASNLCCDVQPACDSVAPAAVAPPAGNGNAGANTFTPDNNGAANEPGLEDTNKVIRSSPANGAKPTPPVVPQDSSVGGARETAEPAAPASAPAAAPAETEPEVPTMPAPDSLLAPPPAASGVEHEVQRPIYSASSTARSTLRGKIVSATDGKPEKGVTVTLADARGRFKEKTRVTDADGTFSVVLPEGDWSVLVPSVDGKGVIERPITVSGGLITDDKDTAVSVLTLNR